MALKKASLSEVLKDGEAIARKGQSLTCSQCRASLEGDI